MKWRYIYLIVLFVFGGLIFFYNLGGWDLWNPDEPRYAQVAREMLQGEGWIIPHLNGEVYLDKPPLFFWLQAAAATAVGGMTEAAARLPSAVFGLATILLLFFFGVRLFSERTGFFASLILATNVEYIWLARRANIDATLTFFTTAAIFLFYLGFQARRGRWSLYLLAYLAMALGVLAKLQVGIVVPLLVVAGYFLFRRQFGFFIDKAHLPGILVFVAVIGGWFSLAYHLGGWDYLWGLIYQKTASTFLETASHDRPLYYYLLNFPANFLPWTIFLPSAIIYGFSAKGKREGFVFALFWFVVVFCFFSIAKAKRELYLLPLYPAASLMIAYLLSEVPLGAEGSNKRLVLIPFIFLVVSLAVVAIAGLIAAIIKGGEYFHHPLELGVVTAMIVGGGVLVSYLAHRYRRRDLPFYVICATVALLTLYGAHRIFPEINRYKSARPIAEAIIRAMRPGDELGIYQLEGANIIYYTGYNRMRWLKDEDELKGFLGEPKRVLCIMRKRHYVALQGDQRLPLFLVATGRVGSKDLVVISNRKLYEGGSTVNDEDTTVGPHSTVSSHEGGAAP